jgi:mycofactocin precursor
MMQISPEAVRCPCEQTRGIAMENTQNTEVVLEEALIEEVSIDGMCGVY